MKKIVWASVLLLLLAAVSFAEGSNYQIYSEGKGFLGWGGRRVIMLDKATGDSWLYVDDKWKPIVKEATAEGTSSVDEIRAKLEAEIAALKEKHLAEIKTLTDKQEQELATLKTMPNADKPSAEKAAEPAARKARPVSAKKKVEAAPANAKKTEDNGDNGASEAPPAWLNE
jgi:hypothetical protein